MKFWEWVLRWWLVGAVVVAEVLAFWVLWAYGHLSGHVGVAVQISVTAFTTVFVGVLARNNSKEQAEAAEKREQERDLRSRSSQLMSHQAEAITHLGSKEPIVVASGIWDLVGLMRGWTTLTDDSLKAGHEDAWDVWGEHVQQLVNLVYKQPLSSGAETLRDTVTEARSEGITYLNKRLPEISSSEISLSALDFSYADLSLTVLREIDFRNANLEGANFEESDISTSKFMGADLRAATLLAATLNEQSFKDAQYNTSTKLSGHPGLGNIMKLDS